MQPVWIPEYQYDADSDGDDDASSVDDNDDTFRWAPPSHQAEQQPPIFLDLSRKRPLHCVESDNGESAYRSALAGAQRRMRQRRQRQQSDVAVESPIHPAIDASATLWCPSRRFDGSNSSNSSRSDNASTGSKPVPPRPTLMDLSRALVDYLRQSRGCYQNADTSSPTLVSTESTKPDHTQPSDHSDDNDERRIHRSSTPVLLKHALDFTSTPRILLESAPPYRTVHANAAFGQLRVLPRDASEVPTTTETHRSLATAIRALVGNTTDVTVHPVSPDPQGVNVSHYLIQLEQQQLNSTVAANGADKRQPLLVSTSAQTVG